MAKADGPKFPFQQFAFFNRGKGLAELEPLQDLGTYQRLQSALAKIADMESLPPLGKRGNKKARLRNFLLSSKINAGLASRLLRIHEDRSDKGRRMKSIRAVEAKVMLGFLHESGLLHYDTPAVAFSGEEDMLFHAFAKQSGAPNQGSIAAEGFHELYEMYSVDVGPVLAEQGRYNIFCGYLEVESAPHDPVVKARFLQPSGAAPGGVGREEYAGYFFLQDDTVYVMGFKSEADEDRGDDMVGLLGAEKPKATPRGQRRNLAMMILNGLSRSADGLYDKMVGGQVGRGLTGATGVLSSPCVLYRVTDERIQQLENLMVATSEYEADNGRYSETYRRRFNDYHNISAREKAKFYRSEVIGAKSIISGIDLIDVGVMSDLNIPVPLQLGGDHDNSHVDINVYKGN